MKLHVLGCGTIVQEVNRNCSGYLFDGRVLFDCGPGIWRAIGKNRISLTQIDHIFLTHFHLDHVNDLPALLMSRWLDVLMRQIPLNIVGPIGLKNWFDSVYRQNLKWISDLEIQLTEMSTTDFAFDDYIVSAKATGHTINSLAYRITTKSGISAFYSGDTGWNTDLIPLAKYANLAIIEASNTPETKVDGHLTPELAARLAGEARVKTLLLTHPYPEVLSYNLKKATESIFSGKIILAEDNLQLTIT